MKHRPRIGRPPLSETSPSDRFHFHLPRDEKARFVGLCRRLKIGPAKALRNLVKMANDRVVGIGGE